MYEAEILTRGLVHTTHNKKVKKLLTQPLTYFSTPTTGQALSSMVSK